MLAELGLHLVPDQMRLRMTVQQQQWWLAALVADARVYGNAVNLGAVEGVMFKHTMSVGHRRKFVCGAHSVIALCRQSTLHEVHVPFVSGAEPETAPSKLELCEMCWSVIERAGLHFQLYHPRKRDQTASTRWPPRTIL